MDQLSSREHQEGHNDGRENRQEVKDEDKNEVKVVNEEEGKGEDDNDDDNDDDHDNDEEDDDNEDDAEDDEDEEEDDEEDDDDDNEEDDDYDDYDDDDSEEDDDNDNDDDDNDDEGAQEPGERKERKRRNVENRNGTTVSETKDAQNIGEQHKSSPYTLNVHLLEHVMQTLYPDILAIVFHYCVETDFRESRKQWISLIVNQCQAIQYQPNPFPRLLLLLGQYRVLPPSGLSNLFVHLCKKGMLGIVMHLTKKVFARETKLLGYCFLVACRHANLHIATWLAHHLVIETRLAARCLGQVRDLGMAKWITGRFQLQNNNTRRQELYLLQNFLETKQFDAAAWTVQHFEINRVSIFVGLCFDGNLEGIKWFTEIFGLEQGKKALRYEKIFEIACVNGQLQVAKWLLQHLGSDIRASGINVAVLYLTAEKGHVEILDWLYSEMDWSDIRTYQKISKVMELACRDNKTCISQSCLRACFPYLTDAKRSE